MNLYKARDLLPIPRGLLLAGYPRRFQVQFEDGVTIESSLNELVYSSFIWEFHRQYPLLPLNSNHHVQHVLKGKMATSDTHREMMSIMTKDVVHLYGFYTPKLLEPIRKLIYRITNDIHNDAPKYAEAYVGTIDILDFIQAETHPIIRSACLNAEPTSEGISNVYAIVEKTLLNDPTLANNAIAIAVRGKMAKFGQVCQCISIRGIQEEVNGDHMPTPIFSNFTRGLSSLYELIAESRGAARAMYFSETPLQDAEYFARRIQLNCMVVESIFYGDCGSTHYLDWIIQGPIYDETGRKTYSGDQTNMIGKYYMDEESHKLKQITHDDPALYGRLIRLRSGIFCKHSDPHAICEVCFGALAKNVSRFANIGHLCATTMTEQTTQSVLSTKHLLVSAEGSEIIMNSILSKFFTTNRGKNEYIAKPDLKTKKAKLVINRDQAPGLTDILGIENLEDMSPTKISRVTEIEIRYEENGRSVNIDMVVMQRNRGAVLTVDFLNFLKDRHWEVDSHNNFVFDLSGWNFSLPILYLPKTGYSFADHSKQIADMIESTVKNQNARAKPSAPATVLQELFQLVNSKLGVTLSALEVIIYASMIPSIDNYDLARNHPSPVLGINELCIRYRSLGPALAYEKQLTTITNPRSFFKLNRVSSVIDVFFAPREVVEEQRAKDLRELTTA